MQSVGRRAVACLWYWCVVVIPCCTNFASEASRSVVIPCDNQNFDILSLVIPEKRTQFLSLRNAQLQAGLSSVSTLATHNFYECILCGQRFARGYDYRVHERVHTGERPYQCSICGVSFAQKGNLTTHKRTHFGERPYECDSCDKKFARSNSLVVHKRSHTKESPYKCEKCEKTFIYQRLLKKHVCDAKDIGQDLRCSECFKSFTYKGCLVRHKKRMHPQQQESVVDSGRGQADPFIVSILEILKEYGSV